MDSPSLTVYFIHGDPVWHVNDESEECYQLKAQVTLDGGTTTEQIWLTFETEEEALKFTETVNGNMEPTPVGLGFDDDE